MNKGTVAQVIGPVVDVDFSNAKTPAILNALTLLINEMFQNLRKSSRFLIW